MHIERQVIILRGLPGSGKSTMAQMLVYGLRHNSSAIHCPDDFFIDQTTGEYRFVGENVPKAHANNLEQFITSLSRQTSLVIYDATNHRRIFMKPYIEAAEDYGYNVAITSMVLPPRDSLHTFARRNIHGVPLHVISRMYDEWEF